jgi:hypothetical protein
MKPLLGAMSIIDESAWMVSRGVMCLDIAPL